MGGGFGQMAVSDRALRNRLAEAANIIAAGVRSRSAWSENIPRSVRVSVRGAGGLPGSALTAAITAGGVEAPMAYTFEAPARRGHRAGYPVNHPVFGRPDRLRTQWTWVAQPPRPFMLPAADEDSDKALRQFAKVVDDWAREDGFV